MIILGSIIAGAAVGSLVGPIIGGGINITKKGGRSRVSYSITEGIDEFGEMYSAEVVGKTMITAGIFGLAALAGAVDKYSEELASEVMNNKEKYLSHKYNERYNLNKEHLDGLSRNSKLSSGYEASDAISEINESKFIMSELAYNGLKLAADEDLDRVAKNLALEELDIINNGFDSDIRFCKANGMVQELEEMLEYINEL